MLSRVPLAFVTNVVGRPQPQTPEEDWQRWWSPRDRRGGRKAADDALIGGRAAIAAFFDYPVSGCLFVMELPHMHGSVQKGNILPAALIASICAWWSHRYIMETGNIMPSPTFPPACITIGTIWWFLPMGLFIGAFANLFVRTRRFLDTLPYPAWARGLILGALVGFIGLLVPDTLTWGEFQIEILANFRTPRGVEDSSMLAIAKFATIVMTIASGCTAGIVYPLIMIGSLFGPLVASIIDPLF